MRAYLKCKVFDETVEAIVGIVFCYEDRNRFALDSFTGCVT
jgi:hypothetical protein